MDEDEKALADFISNNRELEELEEKINYFNIFKALDLPRNEVRHSRFLSWLLRPNETHGLGQYFLRIFLKRVSIDAQNKTAPTVFDIDSADFDDAEVFIEKEHIDVLIVSPNNRIVVAIENKVDSGEHSDQLKRYRTIIERDYASYKHLFVFLTVEGDIPSDENYVRISYSEIVELIDQLISAQGKKASNEILTFIMHYREMLRREIMGNSEIEELCRRIYKRHKKALDLIYENMEDKQSLIYEILMDTLQNNKEIIIDYSSKAYIRFLSKSMDIVPKKGKGWVESNRVLLLEFLNVKDKVIMWLWVGPSEDQGFREKLYRITEDSKILSVYRPHKKWTRLYRKLIANKQQLEEMDNEELRDLITKQVENFFQTDLKTIEEDVKRGIIRLGIA
jgi:hypothetical protein